MLGDWLSAVQLASLGSQGPGENLVAGNSTLLVALASPLPPLPQRALGSAGPDPSPACSTPSSLVSSQEREGPPS